MEDEKRDFNDYLTNSKFWPSLSLANTVKGKKKDRGYEWIFEHTEVFIDEEYQLEEKDYFEKRTEEFKIEFKKEPPKTVTNNLDVSRFFV